MRGLRIYDFGILIVLLTIVVGAGCTHSRTALRSPAGYATVNAQASKSSVENITLILEGRESLCVGDLELTAGDGTLHSPDRWHR